MNAAPALQTPIARLRALARRCENEMLHQQDNRAASARAFPFVTSPRSPSMRQRTRSRLICAHPAIALCAALLAAGCASRAAETPAPATASLGGVIRHPAQAVPHMRICALRADVPADLPAAAQQRAAASRCVHTRHGDDTYRIDGLAAGEYVVIARVERGMYAVGGHVQPVQCIRAPCPEMLAPVRLAAAQAREDIDLNGFYDERPDFPPLPAPP
jgi:hypothetical protein